MENTAGNGKLPIIGLTGGMGSGKSTVARILALRGGYILDADEINHAQMRKGMPAHKAIAEAFGANVLDADGEIARRLLAAVVFNDAAKLQILVDITHGHVIAATVLAIESLQADHQGFRFIVIDAPLLIEANMHSICDAVWVVTAGEETRVARVVARDGLTKEQALARIQKQLPQDVQERYADCLLRNDNDFDALEADVEQNLQNVLRTKNDKQ